MRLVIFFAALAHIEYMVLRRGWFEKELVRNDSTEPPSDRKLKRGLRHMNEDMYILVTATRLLLFAVTAFIIFK